ncbi:MAG: ABC transporter permease [Legionellaceae bacterium]|nr:ABC transporter permease [Legionellaceae bacterium]
MSVIWSYRGFILASVKREFQLKYRNSLLGVIWTILNPLCMIFIYTVIFSQVMKARLPGVENTFAYSIYLCSGIITWFFFSETLSRSISVFVDNASLIKKLTFPRICLPIIVILGSVLNFSIMFALFTLFLCFTGNFPGWVYLATPIVLIIQITFAMGLGMFLGVLNVFFRDVGQFFTLFLQIWFWLTPIVYSVTILPVWVQSIIKLNPMFSIVNAYHDIFVSHCLPSWLSLMPVIGLSLLCCLLAQRTFHKRNADMVDEL